jgi:BirA family biotin operon repressor/biotin-[acetyl-CoA-carboxylase] ligase
MGIENSGQDPRTGVSGEGDRFDAEALQMRLAGCGITWQIRHVPVADSTNRLAMGLVREGAPEGTVVIAESQSAGRGRLQRVWQSPPGLNLYLSVILRPAIAPADAAQVTLMAGVAVAETIADLGIAGVGLKWPNDVQIQGRKVCGILTEARMEKGSIGALVVGIGVNVNIRRDRFAPAHRQSATSLKEEAGQTQNRQDVAFALCRHFEKWYGLYLGQGFATVREAWLARSGMVGKSVRILFREELQEGRVAGIDRDGALLLTDAAGTLTRITAGDATILK